MNEEQVKVLVEALLAEMLKTSVASTAVGKFVVTTTWKIEHGDVKSVGEVDVTAKWDAESK